jgi:hypothetical protein
MGSWPGSIIAALGGILVQPGGMARGALGAAPLFKHNRRQFPEFGILLRRADVAGEFEPVAVGVEEIDQRKMPW